MFTVLAHLFGMVGFHLVTTIRMCIFSSYLLQSLDCIDVGLHFALSNRIGVGEMINALPSGGLAIFTSEWWFVIVFYLIVCYLMELLCWFPMIVNVA